MSKTGKTGDMDATGRKIFAVGDVHGCSGKLTRLMKRLPFDAERDHLVFLGDYINRGPQSREVIETLLGLKQSARNAVFLMGNHEHSLLEYARTGDPYYLRVLRPMGVEATMESYGTSQTRALRDLSFLPREHKTFLEGLSTYHRLDGYLFIHAGIIPGEELECCSLDRLLTVRDTFLRHGEPMESVVVFGHTPFETPYVTSHKIGIDTGAALGNLLTAVELPRLRFHHA